MKFPSPLILALAGSAMVAGAAPTKLPATSAAAPSYAASVLVNGTYGDYFPVAAGNWAAFRPDRAVDTLFLTWNNPAYSWSDSLATAGSCKSRPGVMSSYRILTSDNSSDGSDGDWDTILTVANHVTSRAHVVPFAGKTWIKLLVVAGSGALDEIELFDKAALGDDSWFFVGNSITANAFKSALPDSTFAEQVAALDSTRYPATVRGGIPCITTPQMLSDFTKYHAIAGNCRYWAIELGTNDGYGGYTHNLESYTEALAGILDSALSHGIVPIVARVISTDSSAAGWQVAPGFLRAIDSLTTAKGLPVGPDLHAWFLAHPDEFNTDGIHPNAAGGASIQRLWAEVAARQKVTSLSSRSGASRPARLGGVLVRGTPEGAMIDAKGRASSGGALRTQFGK